MTEYQRGEWDMFNLITSVYFGKQYYFLQDSGCVYSRESGKEMSFDDAFDEFAKMIGDDGSI